MRKDSIAQNKKRILIQQIQAERLAVISAHQSPTPNSQRYIAEKIIRHVPIHNMAWNLIRRPQKWRNKLLLGFLLLALIWWQSQHSD